MRKAEPKGTKVGWTDLKGTAVREAIPEGAAVRMLKSKEQQQAVKQYTI